MLCYEDRVSCGEENIGYQCVSIYESVIWGVSVSESVRAAASVGLGSDADAKAVRWVGTAGILRCVCGGTVSEKGKSVQTLQKLH